MDTFTFASSSELKIPVNVKVWVETLLFCSLGRILIVLAAALRVMKSLCHTPPFYVVPNSAIAAQT